MSLETNTYSTSIYLATDGDAAVTYLRDGMMLNEWTLRSRMRSVVDADTWLGSASGYQTPLYYHSRVRTLGDLRIVEWHCGAEHHVYHHVYPMLLVSPAYWGSSESGVYFHWISFVDPTRATPMIVQGMPSVHSSEARSLKARLETARGLTGPAPARLTLTPHTIFIDATVAQAASYLGDPGSVADWGFMISKTADGYRDEYGHPIKIRVAAHDLGSYTLIEHDTSYGDGITIRTPILLIPASYAFGDPNARGLIMHRTRAWSVDRVRGKQAPSDYDAEAINMKRIIELAAGNGDSFALGCSYRGSRSA